jgi:hypothetical protein
MRRIIYALFGISDPEHQRKQHEIDFLSEFFTYCEFYGYEQTRNSMRDFLKRRKESPWMNSTNEKV